MRLGADWMVYADDRILEYLQENGPKSPTEISSDDRFPWTTKHIGDRCRKLLKYGLVERYGRGVYGISEQGKEYLNGNLDVRNLKED